MARETIQGKILGMAARMGHLRQKELNFDPPPPEEAPQVVADADGAEGVAASGGDDTSWLARTSKIDVKRTPIGHDSRKYE